MLLPRPTTVVRPPPHRHCDRYTTAALGHWPPWPLRLPFLFVTHFLVDLQRAHALWLISRVPFKSVLNVFTMSVMYLISKSINSLKSRPVGVLSCIPGAQACVLVFSTTDRESYQAIDSWREKVEAEVGDIPTVLVQNKIDLLEDTVIKKFVIVYFMPK